jgi:tetratricopeptide (TPR) repeat protein
MSGIAEAEPLRSRFIAEFEKMTDSFRVQVANNERILASSPDRNTRSSIAYGLARDCNQLAWLLSKCKSSPEEAVNLSLRSLEFYSDNPAYLDTLGRCYFSAGEINEAVRTQRKAVELAPYDRLMRLQLDEFESALHLDSERQPE